MKSTNAGRKRTVPAAKRPPKVFVWYVLIAAMLLGFAILMPLFFFQRSATSSSSSSQKNPTVSLHLNPLVELKDKISALTNTPSAVTASDGESHHQDRMLDYLLNNLVSSSSSTDADHQVTEERETESHHLLSHLQTSLSFLQKMTKELQFHHELLQSKNVVEKILNLPEAIRLTTTTNHLGKTSKKNEQQEVEKLEKNANINIGREAALRVFIYKQLDAVDPQAIWLYESLTKFLGDFYLKLRRRSALETANALLRNHDGEKSQNETSARDTSVTLFLKTKMIPAMIQLAYKLADFSFDLFEADETKHAACLVKIFYFQEYLGLFTHRAATLEELIALHSSSNSVLRLQYLLTIADVIRIAAGDQHRQIQYCQTIFQKFFEVLGKQSSAESHNEKDQQDGQSSSEGEGESSMQRDRQRRRDFKSRQRLMAAYAYSYCPTTTSQQSKTDQDERDSKRGEQNHQEENKKKEEEEEGAGKGKEVPWDWRTILIDELHWQQPSELHCVEYWSACNATRLVFNSTHSTSSQNQEERKKKEKEDQNQNQKDDLLISKEKRREKEIEEDDQFQQHRYQQGKEVYYSEECDCILSSHWPNGANALETPITLTQYRAVVLRAMEGLQGEDGSVMLALRNLQLEIERVLESYFSSLRNDSQTIF